jgi:hypothetical protein
MPYLSKIICPHCNHEYTNEDMETAENDLWAAAPQERTVEETCVACLEEFVVAGSYKPSWKTARNHDAMDLT